MKTKVQDELKQHFRPEFLNRVDDIVVFHQLTQEEIVTIVDLMLAKLDERLRTRTWASSSRRRPRSCWPTKGYDPVLGARPLRRTIQREIEDVLSEKILFGELRPGQIVLVDVEGEGEEAEFTFAGEQKAAAARRPAGRDGDDPGVAGRRPHQPVGRTTADGPARRDPGGPFAVRASTTSHSAPSPHVVNSPPGDVAAAYVAAVAGHSVRVRLRAAGGAFAATWSNPDLRRAQLGFASAWTAEWAFTVGLGVLAFEQGGAAAVGLVSLLRMVPSAVVTPFVTVYADRWRRERLLVAVSVVRACAVGLVAVLVAVGAPVVSVYVLAVVATATAAVFRPVHSALLPSLCRTPAELAGANVVRGMLDSLSTLVGPALAAVLLATSGLSGVFTAVAVASLLSAVLIARVRPETGPAPDRRGRRGVLPDLVEGLGVVRASHDLTLLIVLAGAQTFARGALAVFSVVVAIDLLEMGESGVGVLNAAVGAGAVLGSLAASLLVGNHRLARWFGLGVAGWGLPMALIGIHPRSRAWRSPCCSSSASRTRWSTSGSSRWSPG